MLDGIVYKLCCKDATEFYIGSTKDLYKRRINHKTICNNVKGKLYNKKLYKYIRDNGGFDEFDFEILELGEYEDKYCMRDRERYFIETLKPTLNSDIPNRSEKEWRDNNTEKIKEQRKEHYQKNKKIINENNNKYYANNREKTNEKQREKITCKVCNSVITKRLLPQHIQTQKHLNNLNNTG
tara:strand:- start:80 stop:625 length:546 start_codon:yes stop_codon:yes gene_type:complete